jgi:hypothetical protein
MAKREGYTAGHIYFLKLHVSISDVSTSDYDYSEDPKH